LRLIEDGKETTAPVRAAAKAEELGAQDYVVLALKAHSVAPALDQIAPLLGDHTSVVTMQNGVPWWYFYKAGGALEGTRLHQVDPGGTIWDRLGPQRVIGSVVY
ncbi:MAG: oxidoreductase, partial [Mesorhizobium sp.]